MRPEPTPDLGPFYWFEGGEEEFAWDGKAWLSLSEAGFPCYGHWRKQRVILGYASIPGQHSFFYQWRGVELDASDLPGPRYLGISGDVIDFTISGANRTIVPVDPPVQFHRDADGAYRPGYYDFFHHVFYQWRDVIVPVEQVPPESPQHRTPVLEEGPRKVRDFTIREIDIPPQWRTIVKPWIVAKPATAP